jgi:hypothetical protein
LIDDVKSKKNKKNNDDGVAVGIYSVIDEEGETHMIIVLDNWVVCNNRWAVGDTDGLNAIVVVSQVVSTE